MPPPEASPFTPNYDLAARRAMIFLDGLTDARLLCHAAECGSLPPWLAAAVDDARTVRLGLFAGMNGKTDWPGVLFRVSHAGPNPVDVFVTRLADRAWSANWWASEATRGERLAG